VPCENSAAFDQTYNKRREGSNRVYSKLLSYHAQRAKIAGSSFPFRELVFAHIPTVRWAAAALHCRTEWESYTVTETIEIYV
jgi:hypothetical protein